MVKITEVSRRSRAAKAGILAGDVLISVNGNEINDVLDYRFYLADEDITLCLERDGVSFETQIFKDTYDDIGLSFETPLMDKKHSCKNKCIFCFIDQLPDGMRESLYFKDDDSRLSFLHGNYITLTNLTEADIDRIVKMHISPINISVHTMNPDLRVSMMKNKNAGKVLSYLDKIKEAGLTMRAQIVLCKGVNDGDELLYSMQRLTEYLPELDSVSIVPAGLTAHREGLYPLEQFTRDEAESIIDTVTDFGHKLLEKHGTRLFFVGDELYLTAERPLPDADYYEGYPQIENGVGMLRSFIDGFGVSLDTLTARRLMRRRHVSVATGEASYPFISEMCAQLEKIYPRLTVSVHKIVNDFFGHSITVSGLMTGRDICNQLAGKELGRELLLPDNCLRDGEDVFLCGMTVSELEKNLSIKVRMAGDDADSFVSAVLGKRRR